MCRKPGSDDIDAVQRKHRNEQMALDPLAQLVPDRAQPEFGLEKPECRFQFSQAPVGANRILNAPLRVAGAQDIMARSGIARIIFCTKLEKNDNRKERIKSRRFKSSQPKVKEASCQVTTQLPFLVNFIPAIALA